MRADLHTHSYCSDGIYSPAELVRMAKEAGVELFAVTDHDSMSGCEEGAEAASKAGIRFVRGWEVSAYEGDGKVHILGYGCKSCAAYKAFLQKRFLGAQKRAAATIDLANRFYGLDVTMEEVEGYHVQKDAPLHVTHVVRTFARRLQRDVGELFNEAFSFGGPAFVSICRPTPEEALEVIQRSGGVAVLAHPGRIHLLTLEEWSHAKDAEGGEKAEWDALDLSRRHALIERLMGKGLFGIECYHSTHTVMETEFYLSFARERGLAVTGGSDYHEPGRRSVGRPLFQADEELQERLLALDGSV